MGDTRLNTSEMVPIFRWDGEYFGFVRDGYLFDRSARYVGWVEEGTVWLKDGRYLGHQFEQNYVVRPKYALPRPPRAPRVLPLSPLSPLPPLPRLRRLPRLPSLSYDDALGSLVED